MHNNQAYTEFGTKNIGPHKWWHHRWAKIIFISFIVLTILAVTLSLVLKFAVFRPKKSEITTTTTTPPLTTTAPTSLASSSTIPTTTTQQS
ncbi:unnamed protein product, partial [Rotaria sp. Silwood1]